MIAVASGQRDRRCFSPFSGGGGGGFAAPDILNATFESGFDGMCDQGYNAVTSPTRDNTRAHSGTWSVKFALPHNLSSDGGGALCYPFVEQFAINSYSPSGLAHCGESRDRLFHRFYFYFDAAWDGTHKWGEPYATQGFNNPDMGGLGLEGGDILWAFHAEAAAWRLRSLSGLINGWHSIETDYWRNGDTGNGGNDYPSVGVWIDGVACTQANTVGSYTGNDGSWIGSRFYCNNRGAATSNKLGTMKMCGIVNAHSGTFDANYWLDDIALSTQRIGP